MPWRHFKFWLICLFLWPVAIFVAGQMQPYVVRAVWWLAIKSGATTLSQAQFLLNAWLPLSFLEGFVLGLVPIETLRRLLVDGLARFRHMTPVISIREWDLARPILWAWVLPTLFFLVRFTMWGFKTPQGAFAYLPWHESSRVAHFFEPPNGYTLAEDPRSWFFDRMMFTVPMFFTLAYTLAVWLREHMPKHPTPVVESSPELPEPASADTLGS